MARKRPSPSATPITVERAARLYRLVRLLGQRPHTRAQLLNELDLELRGFYRDLETLRKVGIAITLQDGRYSLATDRQAALALLPLPDPGLTLGEAQSLSQGPDAVQKKLRRLIAAVQGKGRK